MTASPELCTVCGVPTNVGGPTWCDAHAPGTVDNPLPVQDAPVQEVVSGGDAATEQ